MNEFNFPLKHVALYAKHHYELSGNIWEDIKKCIEADGYVAYDSKSDILNIVMRNVLRIETHHDKEYVVTDILESIAPDRCWRHGYYTKDMNWGNVKYTNEYDQKEAILRYFLSELSMMEVVKLGGLPEASEDVLPFSETKIKNMTEESVNKILKDCNVHTI